MIIHLNTLQYIVLLCMRYIDIKQTLEGLFERDSGVDVELEKI